MQTAYQYSTWYEMSLGRFGTSAETKPIIILDNIESGNSFLKQKPDAYLKEIRAGLSTIIDSLSDKFASPTDQGKLLQQAQAVASFRDVASVIDQLQALTAEEDQDELDELLS